MAGEHGSRPNFRDFFNNWGEYDAAFPEKTRLALRNYWRRVQQRSNCCGHEREPGCCQVEKSEKTAG